MLLKDNLFRINFNDIYKAIYPFSLIIIFMYLSIILYNFYNINVWRHDCIRYITSYQIQLQSEGRWLVYTLFDALRLLNPTFVGILNIIFIYIGHKNICVGSHGIHTSTINIHDQFMATSFNLCFYAPCNSLLAS